MSYWEGGRENYWSRIQENRIARRRLLKAGGAFSIGAASLALIGCGDDDDEAGSNGNGSGPSATPGTSSLVAPYEDTSQQAVRGGLLRHWVEGDEENFDPVTTSRGTGYGGPTRFAYTRLLREAEGPGGLANPEYIGDFAESWELPDDGRELVVKLRQDVKLDPREPTSGRNLDADDVVFTWERVAELSPYRTQLSYAADSTAPVESVTKIDDYTVVFKLAFPWYPLLSTLASGVLTILPREADGGFDPRNTVRGAGPWMLESHTPAVGFEWRRNPNYYNADVPYLEGFSHPIISEVAAQEAAFRSRQADVYEDISPDNVLALMNDLPDTLLYQSKLGPNVHQLMFGNLPDSKFRDIRVRQAASMAIDRQLWADVETNQEAFNAAGIPYDITIDSHLTAQYADTGLWLDPTTDALGEGAKYFQYNPEETKKLLDAAGYADGLDATFWFSSRGADNQTKAERASAMLNESGFNTSPESADYQTVWLPVIYVAPPGSKGEFEGMGRGGSTSSLPNVMSFIYARLHSLGAFTGARAWEEQMPIDETITEAMKELDDDRRMELIHEIQRDLAVAQSTVSYGSGFYKWSMTWPWIKNWGFRASWDNFGSRDTHRYVWLDESKR